MYSRTRIFLLAVSGAFFHLLTGQGLAEQTLRGNSHKVRTQARLDFKKLLRERTGAAPVSRLIADHQHVAPRSSTAPPAALAPVSFARTVPKTDLIPRRDEHPEFRLDRLNHLLPPNKPDGAPAGSLQRVSRGQHVLTVAGGNLYIEMLSGKPTRSLSIEDLWSGLSPNSPVCRVTDLHLSSDPVAGRWMLAATADPGLPSAGVIVAVSETTDPAGVWNARLLTVTAAGRWPHVLHGSLTAKRAKVIFDLQPLQGGAACGRPLADVTAAEQDTLALDPVLEPLGVALFQTDASNVPPSADWVNPSFGVAAAKFFFFHFSDANGFADIKDTVIVVNSDLSAATSCTIYHANGSSIVFLANDAGTAFESGTSNTDSVLQNSQCAVNLRYSYVSNTGNDFSLNLALTFKPAFGGAKLIYMFASDAAGTNTGWSARAIWIVPISNVAPTLGLLWPSSGSGTSGFFSADYEDPNGPLDIMEAHIRFGDSNINACRVRYVRSTNQFGLLNDAATAYLEVTTGSATVENTQCILQGSSSSVSAYFDRLNIGVALKFKSAFGGTRNIYTLAADAGNLNSGLQLRGAWIVPAGNFVPNVVVYPSTGVGIGQQFVLSSTDENGFADVDETHFLIGASPNSIANACYMVHDVDLNVVRLYDDTGASFLSLPFGTTNTVENSQCILSGSGTSTYGSGNTRSLYLNLRFKSAFGGDRSLYANVIDHTGAAQAWRSIGAWFVPVMNIPPLLESFSPTSGSGGGTTFTVSFRDVNGDDTIGVIALLVNTTVSEIGGCLVAYLSASNQLALWGDNGAFSTLTPGTNALVQNSQCIVEGLSSRVERTNSTRLSVDIRLIFKPALAGTKNVYILAADTGGLATGWLQKGTWTIP